MASKLTHIRRRNRQTFEEVADEYDKLRQLPWQDCIAPLAELERASLILDAGAGTGRQALALAQMGFNVIALDFSLNMLNRLHERAASLYLDSRISIVVADLFALPLRELVCDGVEFVATLHHLPSKQLRKAALQEIFRATKQGGRCVISVWLRGQRGFYYILLLSALNALLGRSEWGDVWISWGQRPRFYHLFGSKELSAVVSRSGFRIGSVEVRSFGREESSSRNRNLLVQASKI